MLESRDILTEQLNSVLFNIHIGDRNCIAELALIVAYLVLIHDDRPESSSDYLLGAEFGRRIESVDIHDSGRVDNVNETVFLVICTADISYHSDTLCNDGAKSDKSEYTADYSQNSVLSSLSLDDLH